MAWLFCIGLALIAGIIIIWQYLRLRKISRSLWFTQRERDNFRNICKEGNDALMVIDIADGRIHEVNYKIAELLGFSEAQLLKMTLFDLHPKEMLERSATVISEVWEQQGLLYQDLPFRAANGELFPVECSAKVMPYTGRPTIVIYARDIRERIRLENEIRHQKELIEEKNQDLTDSIIYARRIQQAILPEEDKITAAFPNSFILYLPKDIVSGDFFWFTKRDNRYYLAIADCTGHGVPGAFMSMIGSSFLAEIVNTKGILEPDKILNELHIDIRSALKQNEGGSGTLDGMDLALCCYLPEERTLQYAGAMRPLLVVKPNSTGELSEITADKFPIGGRQIGERVFTLHQLAVNPGDTIYMYSDGFTDQFGGDSGRKFMQKNFRNVLTQLQPLSMPEQAKELKTAFYEWKGKREQLDDVLVAGIRF